MKHECGGKLITKDTRQIDAGIWRRRVCEACRAEVTTLEQECQTLKKPYADKTAKGLAGGEIIARPVPPVPRPAPKPDKRRTPAAKVERAAALQEAFDVLLPKPKTKTERCVIPPVHRAPPVDRIEPCARDRIEDMKFERENNDHGWDK